MIPTILDLPDEVLFYIFTLVYGDIKKNPFFRYHERHGGRLYARTYYEQSFYSRDEKDILKQWTNDCQTK